MTTTVEPSTAPGNGHSTAIESVLEALLAEIMRGHYPPGEWQLVEPRRGSGIVVRPLADWSIEVLPAYLRYARPSPAMPTTGRLLLDLLALRRVIIRDVAHLVAPRLAGGAGTVAARTQLLRAWATRQTPAVFVREDFLVMRAVVEAAGFLPAVWMLNRVSGVYIEIAANITNQVRVPDDYLEASTAYLDAIDKGDADKAAELVTAYLERHDSALIRALEMIA
jgi:DNA-binding FadR family transcriptional regulator